MKARTTIFLWSLLVGGVFLVQGCQENAASAKKDSAQAVKSFTGNVPETDDYKKKVAEIAQKQQEWNAKMKANGKTGAGAPPISAK